MKLWDNYKKRTPKKWRIRGDFALLGAMIIQIIDFITPFIADAPGLTDLEKYWVPKILSTILIIYKFWTNTKKDQPNEQNIEAASNPAN